MSELARAMELVGNKWALHIVDSLLGGPRRFTEIEHALGDVNPKLIAMPATVRKNGSSITAGRVTGPHRRDGHSRRGP